MAPYPDEQDGHIPSQPPHQVASRSIRRPHWRTQSNPEYLLHPSIRPGPGHHPGIHAAADIAVTDTPSTLCNLHALHIHCRLLEIRSRLCFRSRMLLLVDG